nr:MAG TPA: hypothetical protein [Caudoviricetes sp.]
MKYYIIKILNEQISNECSENALTRTNVWSIIIFVNNKKKIEPSDSNAAPTAFYLTLSNQIHTTALSHCRSEISLEFILHIFRKKVKLQAFSAIKIPNFHN